MATIIEKAMWIAEKSGGIYEVFTSTSDVLAYIADAPEDVEIWAKRIDACKQLLEDFSPCIFDTENATVAAYINNGEFYFDGTTYTND